MTSAAKVGVIARIKSLKTIDSTMMWCKQLNYFSCFVMFCFSYWSQEILDRIQCDLVYKDNQTAMQSFIEGNSTDRKLSIKNRCCVAAFTIHHARCCMSCNLYLSISSKAILRTSNPKHTITMGRRRQYRWATDSRKVHTCGRQLLQPSGHS